MVDMKLHSCKNRFA